ncbi:MAG: DUF58 domain-containing protein [Pirellulaceae bacterium]|nr:DUF58 domain-containing protein [Pirellulaceae bacterium]
MIPSRFRPLRFSIASLAAGLGGALTHDFCPRANRYVEWLRSPLTVLGVAAGVSLAIGWLLLPQGYVVCGGICTVIGLGLIWPWISMSGIAGELHFPRRRAREGEAVEAVLTIVNRRPWPVWGLVLERGFLPLDAGSDRVSPAAASDQVSLALARVPGWSRAEFRWNFVPACRGEYPLQEPLLTTTFPFGLWKSTRAPRVKSRLLVWPRVVPLMPFPIDEGAWWTLGALSDRRAGYEGDVIGARPYRDGDLLRHVHWAQTARLGRLIVCERQASLTAEARVVLDLNPDHHHGYGADSSLEWTLRVGASICQALLHQVAKLHVSVGGRTITVTSGPAGRERLGDSLARYSPAESAPDGPPEMVQPAKSQKELVEFVVTTDLGRRAWSERELDRRLVVLATGARLERAFSDHELPAWCALDLAADPLRQLREQWESGCRHA